MRKISKLIILCAVAASTALFLTYCSGSNDDVEEELKLYVGDLKVIPVNNPIRIVLGNPSVVDVTDTKKSELTLSAKAAGSTTLVIWDSFGEQAYMVKVFDENMQDIKRRIDKLLSRLQLPNVYTQAEDEESKVLILGTVKTQSDKDRIEMVAGTLQNKFVDLVQVKEEEAVVDIEVQVLELDKDASHTLGFTWPGSITINEIGTPGTAVSSMSEVGTSGATTGGTPMGTKWQYLFKVTNLGRAAFSWTLDALVQEGKARILSRPSLACQSGKEAELLVGGEKPVITTSVQGSATSSTSVDYKQYGIKLKIRPTVTDENRIKLVLNVEVSEAAAAADIIGAANAPTARAYPLTKRTISTEVFVNDNQTLAIGGLMKRKEEEQIRKTPFLGDIPIIGIAFRRKVTNLGGGFGEKGNTELFITLTPTIVNAFKTVAQGEKSALSEKGESSSGTARDKGLTQPQEDYARIVQKRILDNLNYPAYAREAGFQGTVKLGLHLSYLGELLNVVVKSSSGYKVLDDNAVYVAKTVAFYPPFPSGLAQKDLWIEVPIAYRLD
ncbi:MAG: TonB family protein [Candidatus Omnitrophica bacterium]|nr:TonB family protein [Candidatus Omnitrophota bacterium]